MRHSGGFEEIAPKAPLCFLNDGLAHGSQTGLVNETVLGPPIPQVVPHSSSMCVRLNVPARALSLTILHPQTGSSK